MRNNYDLILNFEVNDGEPLSEQDVGDMLSNAEFMAKVFESYSDITVWKVIISQAVGSKKVIRV